jgi:protein-tyrosine phosphatase
MGNICRSPTAEGVFRRRVADAGLAQAFEIDSAGTHSYHVGAPSDPRAQAAARKRGVDLSALRARRVAEEDFEYYDHVLAMDRDNLALLAEACPPAQRHKLELFLNYTTAFDDTEVPDPYYGGNKGFEYVLDLVENAADGLLQALVEQHRLKKAE